MQEHFLSDMLAQLLADTLIETARKDGVPLKVFIKAVRRIEAGFSADAEMQARIERVLAKPDPPRWWEELATELTEKLRRRREQEDVKPADPLGPAPTTFKV
jgi:hypothetical protein